MPLDIHEDLPALKALEEENIFAMSGKRAGSQRIRPLEIMVVNLMPKKLDTELQFLRLLSNSPIQMHVTFLAMESHAHIEKFYRTFSEVKGKYFDGLIVTGAPVETVDFEEVDYWEELTEIYAWADSHVFSSVNICWGAQSRLYYDYGINKVELTHKLTGVYQHRVDVPEHPVMRGIDDVFYAPHSRYTESDLFEILENKNLKMLASSIDAGPFVLADINNRDYFLMGHWEYERDTLREEYERDLEKGLSPSVPEHYFVDDNPKKEACYTWKSGANLFFQNWINYAVYQETPYQLEEIAKYQRKTTKN